MALEAIATKPELSDHGYKPYAISFGGRNAENANELICCKIR